MGKNTQGKQWEVKTKQLLEAKDFHVMRMLDNHQQLQRRSVGHKTPPDLIAWQHGSYTCLIECKAQNVNNSWSIAANRISDHQYQWLNEWDDPIFSTRVSYLSLLYYNGERGKSRIYEGYLVMFRDYQRFFENHERKSITYNHVATMGNRII